MRSCLAMVVFLMLAVSGSRGQEKPGAVRITGERSMTNCAQRLTEWYQHNHPSGPSFEITGTGATQGIQALVEGKAEVAQSTRQVLGSEATALRERRGKKFVQVPVATEAAGILVNGSNPVHELSIFELRQILSGAVKNWKQVGGKDAPIKIYGRDDSSDTKEFIESEYMGDSGITSQAATFAKNSALYAAVASDENGIGFGSVNLGLNAKVRFIAIKPSSSAPGFAPTTENISTHKYPLMRQLYFIYAGEPAGELQRFGEWVLSQQGQLVVEAAELFPLGSTDRDHGKMLVAGK